jgi:putative acetyltransferase
LVPNAQSSPPSGGALVGFTTIDGAATRSAGRRPGLGWQLADTLVDEAKRLSPDRISLLVNTDNARAIRFYRRNGFAFAGEDVNPTSGRPVLRMQWNG